MSTLDLLTANLRIPDTLTVAVDGTFTATFTPPLSAPEQAVFADIQTMTKFGIANTLTLAEFQAMKADLALGKAFLGIASPTTAQNNAATKALIRVVGALLRS